MGPLSLCLVARRTHLNSSLIAFWGSNTQQTHAQSGSEPN